MEVMIEMMESVVVELVNKKVRYSKSERRAFTVLSRNGKPLSTVDLMERMYSKGLRRPYHARQVVLGVLTSLGKKAHLNGEPFSVQRSRRKGPHPVEFWLERRAS